MTDRRRIYLDNAATTFPKPSAVYAAVDHYNRCLGAAIGRGSYGTTLEATGIVQRCREKLATLLGAESPDRFVFTFNCTDSLNLAIHGLLGAGDHVVVSELDHNSVLRPLRQMERMLGIDVSRVRADDSGRVDPEEFRRVIRRGTKLVCLVHATNVTGTIQPVEEVGRIAREAGALFLVDAAQTAGHLPIDLRNLPVDLLACPGHKGLLGPLGTGVLYMRPGVESVLESVRQGGTGTRSEDDFQPETLPDKYESGNHNAPGLIGLEAAVSWLLETSVVEIRRQEQALMSQLIEGLSEMPRVRLFGTRDPYRRTGVVSVAIRGMDPKAAAARLDQEAGIEVRAGLHCAPGVHRAIGSFDDGGTIRFSVGPFTTSSEISTAIDAVRNVVTSP